MSQMLRNQLDRALADTTEAEMPDFDLEGLSAEIEAAIERIAPKHLAEITERARRLVEEANKIIAAWPPPHLCADLEQYVSTTPFDLDELP